MGGKLEQTSGITNYLYDMQLIQINLNGDSQGILKVIDPNCLPQESVLEIVTKEATEVNDGEWFNDDGQMPDPWDDLEQRLKDNHGIIAERVFVDEVNL